MRSVHPKARGRTTHSGVDAQRLGPPQEAMAPSTTPPPQSPSFFWRRSITFVQARPLRRDRAAAPPAAAAVGRAHVLRPRPPQVLVPRATHTNMHAMQPPSMHTLVAPAAPLVRPSVAASSAARLAAPPSACGRCRHATPTPRPSQRRSRACGREEEAVQVAVAVATERGTAGGDAGGDAGEGRAATRRWTPRGARWAAVTVTAAVRRLTRRCGGRPSRPRPRLGRSRTTRGSFGQTA